jgi:hypothetical protein
MKDKPAKPPFKDRFEMWKELGYQEYEDGQILIAPETKEEYIIKVAEDLRIGISSLRGISAGAKHYYCNFTYHRYTVMQGDARVGGYLGGLDVDHYMKIDLERYITKKEVDDDPKRWRIFDIGSSTSCFNDKDVMLEYAYEMYLRYFSDLKDATINSGIRNKDQTLYDHLKEEVDYLY